MIYDDEERYTSETIRALFVGENGERDISNFRFVAGSIWFILRGSDEGKRLLGHEFFSVQGVSMEFPNSDPYRRTRHEHVVITGYGVFETISLILADWHKEQFGSDNIRDNNSLYDDRIKPLDLDDLFVDIALKMRDGLSLSHRGCDTVGDQFTLMTDWKDPGVNFPRYLNPVCDFSKFKEDWRNHDHTTFIDLVGEVMMYLKCNVPDWLTRKYNVSVKETDRLQSG